MSIFDLGPDEGISPMCYLREKTLRALHDATALVDLANEPDADLRGVDLRRADLEVAALYNAHFQRCMSSRE